MEKAEKIDKIVKEMNELLKEKKMFEEIKIKKLFNTDNVSINPLKKYEFDIPNFIKNVEYRYIITLSGKKKYLRKCKEFALLNDVPIILVVNFLILFIWKKI